MYEIDFCHPVPVYFIGIGGSNMSGLAELLHSRHFLVSGSDQNHSPVCERLEQMGISVFYSQEEAHISSIFAFVVYTAAIREDNP